MAQPNAVYKTQSDLFEKIEPRQLPKWGWWTLNHRENNVLKQRSYRLDQLEFILENIRTDRDTYMSQGFFKGPNRRAINLAYLTHAYVDLDVYKMEHLQGLSPDQLTHYFLHYCREEANLPIPTYIVFSGNGLYAKWSWKSPIPKAAAGRATAVNKRLVEKLEYFGSDPKATDVSRILRVVGTTNSKTGVKAAMTYSIGPLYDFGDFADEILPKTMEEIRLEREEWSRIKAKKAKKADLLIFNQEKKKLDLAAKVSQSSKTICWQDWHWKVLCDIEMLAKKRFSDGIVDDGQRDLYGFLGAVQLAHTMNGHNLWHEIRAWSRKLLPDQFIDQDFYSHCSSLLDRSKRALNGEKVEWNGKRRSPIYTYKKDTLIEMLSITSDEMTDLNALIDTKEKYRRNNIRRRKTGKSRADYEANSLSKQKPWEQLGMSRAKWYRLGKPTP